ncbi:MAG: type 4a pilus biogenesis protein PilO [Candidatus Nitricoxidivorans perseverans]|uniref:Type 4a pilus biogenesis protein PilO n=1 Tax=Candidatus Nitricoxidivorans perseverans TaxID=2975601 RepID=A0AA49IXZ0_9PROT|nr:MAG: type 4a pilus biogenesis protein PilO [Candidatus Nitricoxidivorans perseverans]
MPRFQLPAIDFKGVVEDFKTLDPKDPGLWPLIPRAIILAGVFALMMSLAWWMGWRVQQEELEAKRQQEEKLKEEWTAKKRQAINLDEHRKQLAEINRSFGALLKQLPNASEMESLLIDINQAGLGRGLQFELFKPGAEVAKDFYAELPITIKISGGYHDLGAFAGDIAKLPRIVTLNDIDVAPVKEGGLSLSAIAKTFRYLDEEELARQRKEKEKAAKGKGGKK